MAAPSRRELGGVWVVAVGLLGVLVVVSILTRSGGDDPDQGRQRPGILDLGDLPSPAPPVPGVEVGGPNTVIFFAGRRSGELCRALQEPPEALTTTRLVVVADDSPDCASPVVQVDLAATDAAARYGLAKPRDGGAPLGYAIVDGEGRLRYRTLDPHAPSLLAEVATMLRALP